MWSQNFTNLSHFYNTFVKNTSTSKNTDKSLGGLAQRVLWSISFTQYEYTPSNLTQSKIEDVSLGLRFLNNNSMCKLMSELCCKIDMPNFTIQQKINDSNGIVNVSNREGIYNTLGGSPVSGTKDTIKLTFYETQIPLIEHMIWDWMVNCQSSRIGKYDLYSIPRVNMRIYIFPNDPAIYTSFKYIIYGMYPIELDSYQPNHELTPNIGKRGVTFSFNNMKIERNTEMTRTNTYVDPTRSFAENNNVAKKTYNFTKLSPNVNEVKANNIKLNNQEEQIKNTNSNINNKSNETANKNNGLFSLDLGDFDGQITSAQRDYAINGDAELGENSDGYFNGSKLNNVNDLMLSKDKTVSLDQAFEDYYKDKNEGNEVKINEDGSDSELNRYNSRNTSKINNTNDDNYLADTQRFSDEAKDGLDKNYTDPNDMDKFNSISKTRLTSNSINNQIHNKTNEQLSNNSNEFNESNSVNSANRINKLVGLLNTIRSNEKAVEDHNIIQTIASQNNTNNQISSEHSAHQQTKQNTNISGKKAAARSISVDSNDWKDSGWNIDNDSHITFDKTQDLNSRIQDADQSISVDQALQKYNNQQKDSFVGETLKQMEVDNQNAIEQQNNVTEISDSRPTFEQQTVIEHPTIVDQSVEKQILKPTVKLSDSQSNTVIKSNIKMSDPLPVKHNQKNKDVTNDDVQHKMINKNTALTPEQALDQYNKSFKDSLSKPE